MAAVHSLHSIDYWMEWNSWGEFDYLAAVVWQYHSQEREQTNTQDFVQWHETDH